MYIDEGNAMKDVAYVNADESIDLSDAYGTLMYVDMKMETEM